MSDKTKYIHTHTHTHTHVYIEATLEVATSLARAKRVEEKFHRTYINYTYFNKNFEIVIFKAFWQ